MRKQYFTHYFMFDSGTRIEVSYSAQEKGWIATMENTGEKGRLAYHVSTLDLFCFGEGTKLLAIRKLREVIARTTTARLNGELEDR